jgi:hypothetical protein
MGSTDISFGMITGGNWFKVPESIKVIFKGKPSKYVTGKDLILEIIRILGVDGVWNDVNEPQISNTPTGTMPEDNKHLGGDKIPAGPHLKYHNVYGYLMVKASREGIYEAGRHKKLRSVLSYNV